MTVNETVINVEVFDSAERLLGLASCELPNIEFATVDVSGFGVAGTLSTPVQGHTSSLELKLSWRTLYSPAVEMLRHGAVNLLLRAALQNYDTKAGTVKIEPLRIDVRGRVKSSELGKLEPASQSENTTVIEVDYLKITVNNKVTAEIDKYSYKYSINGNDYLSEVRSALGLA